MKALRRSNLYSTKMFLRYFLLLCSLHALCAGASVCRTYSPMLSDAAIDTVHEIASTTPNNSMVVEYTCPGADDPKHYTECCGKDTGNGCCPQARYFYEIDKTLATIIAVSVTSTCVLFTLIIAICCFWSKCPLYSACRVQYSHDVATYVSKSDVDMETMPRELGKQQKFTPKNISNGNLPVGADIEGLK